jgi:hypothetical protein
LPKKFDDEDTGKHLYLNHYGLSCFYQQHAYKAIALLADSTQMPTIATTNL